VRATWRILAGRRDLRLVLSAGIISMTGDWILTIGLIYRVYAVTGSTVASALAMACGSRRKCCSARWPGYLSRLAGIIPVLAVQGGGYVLAGLALLACLKEESPRPRAVGVAGEAGKALVGAEG